MAVYARASREKVVDFLLFISYAEAVRQISTALVPPNANEFDAGPRRAGHVVEIAFRIRAVQVDRGRNDVTLHREHTCDELARTDCNK